MARSPSEDPTDQAANRKRSARRLRGRLTAAEKQIKRLFNSLPREGRRETVITNQQTTVYTYAYPPEVQAQFEAQIKAIIDAALLETQGEQVPVDWYWKEDIETPYRQGALETTVDLNRQIAGAIVAGVTIRGLIPRRIEPQQLVTSPLYQRGLQRAYVNNFAVIKTLSDTTANQVIGEINRGIDAGQSPREVGKNISERFDVSRSNADRIARTEINKAYNDATINTVEQTQELTGVRAVVIHISALLTTTRVNHARRHGNAYTPAQQQQWWSENQNRINCYCSVKPVIVDERGRLIDPKIRQEIKAERELFDQLDDTGREPEPISPRDR